MPVLKFYNPVSRRWEPFGMPSQVILDAPGARVRYSAQQTLSNNTVTGALFDIEEHDSHGFWSSSTPSRFTIPAGQAGRYRVYFSTHFQGNAASFAREVDIAVNGTNRVAVARDMNGSAGDGNAINCSADIVLNAGDYVEARAYQNSGGNWPIGWTGMPYQSHMSITRLASGTPGPQGPPGSIATSMPVVRTYPNGGTGTYWDKPPNIHHIIVEVQGGGGGGGSCPNPVNTHADAGGGGGGGYARKLFTATDLLAATSFTVTTGDGGAGGSGVPPGNVGQSGSNGTASSFAGTGITTVQGNGGNGGGAGVDASAWHSGGGNGGAASGGDININGSSGDLGRVFSGSHFSGMGGMSHLGGRAYGGGAPQSGVGYGGGGGGVGNYGAGNPIANGGAGADGVVIITEYYA